MTPPRVIALVDNDRKSDGCSMWRIWQPFAELQRRGFTADWGWNQDDATAMLVSRYDAVVMPRLTWNVDQKHMAETWVDLLHSRGQCLISEWDDDAFGDEIINRHVNFDETMTEEDALNHRIMARFALQLADGVTVTNQHLAAVARRYTDKPVHVVPNVIDLEWWRSVLAGASPRIVPSPTIGWAGGQRPDRDAAAMARAWGRIAQKRSDVTFVVVGHQPSVISEHVPEERIRRLHWLPIDEYPLNFVNIDIGCCPLSSEAFNRSKSSIKALEYAAAGAAVVASPRPYSQCVINGRTGYIVESEDEWESALTVLLDNQARRERMARLLLEDVRRKHSLAVNWWRWPAAWQEIVEDARGRWHGTAGRIAVAS